MTLYAFYNINPPPTGSLRIQGEEMEPTAIDTKASGAPGRPASQTEIPDWVTETPRGTEYGLSICHEEGDLESVDLTRAEFIALKRHLAIMRGLAVPPDDKAESAPAENKSEAAERTAAISPADPKWGEPRQKHEANVAEARIALQGEIGDFDVELLGGFLKVLRRHRGWVTPVEEFLKDLMQDYVCLGARYISPEDVESKLDAFRESLEEAATVARDMLRDFPKLVNGADDEASEVA